MLTIDDFIEKYKKYNDKKLYEEYENIDNLSEDERTALYKAIEEKGGLDSILNNLNKTV